MQALLLDINSWRDVNGDAKAFHWPVDIYNILTWDKACRLI
jgi:hypothetical protein